jgi:type I restriction-modification system DNA methylase subunit
MNYSNISRLLTTKISKTDKKNEGIYFTPPNFIKESIQLLIPFMSSIKNILEPSCGSGEYITGLQEKFGSTKITGIEKNNIIYNSILSLENENINIYSQDYLEWSSQVKYDLIIGNPPYYVIKKENVNKEYYKYFEGRPNIFILFIIKSLKLLNKNGILSFVLPKSFLSCLYYEKTRRYINDNYQILHIIECKEKYLETTQETILFMIQKRDIINNNSFICNISNYIVFSFEENIIKLRELYNNSKSLDELGFKVSVGNVVWNQCKDILTDDDTKTRLIYSSDIEKDKIILKKYSNIEKKNFINKSGITKPMIVLNRGYGVGKYNFEYCLINQSKEYLIENHLICIEYKEEISQDKLIELYKKVLLSFQNNKTIEFIELYFGNNAINTTELNYLLPIYF